MSSNNKRKHLNIKVKKQPKKHLGNWSKKIFNKTAILYSTSIIILVAIIISFLYCRFFRRLDMDDIERSLKHEQLVMRLGNDSIQNGATYDMDIICESQRGFSNFTIKMLIANEDIVTAENVKISFDGITPSHVIPFTGNEYQYKSLSLGNLISRRLYEIDLIYEIYSKKSSANYTDITCLCDNKSTPFKFRINLNINKDASMDAYHARMKSFFQSELECQMYFNNDMRYVVLSKMMINAEKHMSISSRIFKTKYENHSIKMNELYFSN